MNRTKNPAGFQPRVAPAQPLTEEEKKFQIMRFLQQKRENFSLTILKGLCSNPDAVSKTIVATEKRTHTEINNGDILVNKAVEMADLLIEKLYPLPEEESK